MASKAEAVYGGRKPVAIIDFAHPVGGVPQAIILRPTGADFLASLSAEDDVGRTLAFFPRVLAKAKGDKPTGEAFVSADIEKMADGDVTTIDEAVMDALNMAAASEFEPEGDEYELLTPIVLGEVTISRLRFEPRNYGEAKAYHRAQTPAEKLRTFVECFAVNPDDVDMPLRGSILDAMDGEDLVRIMRGFLQRAPEERKSRLRKL